MFSRHKQGRLYNPASAPNECDSSNPSISVPPQTFYANSAQRGSGPLPTSSSYTTSLSPRSPTATTAIPSLNSRLNSDSYRSFPLPLRRVPWQGINPAPAGPLRVFTHQSYSTRCLPPSTSPPSPITPLSLPPASHPLPANALLNVPTALPQPSLSSTTLFLTNFPDCIQNAHHLRLYVPPIGLVSLRVKRATGRRDVGFAEYCSYEKAHAALQWLVTVELLQNILSRVVAPGTRNEHTQPLQTANGNEFKIDGTASASEEHGSFERGSEGCLLPYIDLVSCIRENPGEFVSVLCCSSYIIANWARNPPASRSLNDPTPMETMPCAASLSSVEGRCTAVPGDSSTCSTVFVKLRHNFTRTSGGCAWTAAAISTPARDPSHRESDYFAYAEQTYGRDLGEVSEGNTNAWYRTPRGSSGKNCNRLSGNQMFDISCMVMREEFFSERFAGFCSFTSFLHPPFFGGCFVRFVCRQDALRCVRWMQSQPGLQQVISVEMARKNSMNLLPANQRGVPGSMAEDEVDANGCITNF